MQNSTRQKARLLLGEDGFNRVRQRLEPWSDRLDMLVFEAPDRLLLAGEPVDAASTSFDLAWFGPELFGRGYDQAFLDLVLRSDRMRWMQSGRAGFDDPAFAALIERGILVAMSKGPAPAIAEYVLAQVLIQFQRDAERRQAQREATWRAVPFQEIAGSRWLLVGYGTIGREIAIRARAFGAHLTGVKRSRGDVPELDALATPEQLAAELAQADVVIVSTPLTVETRDSIDARFFAAMKPGALFLNVGRGALMVEDDLRLALDQGAPGHAVLDVTRIEPLPSDSWLWAHAQVTVTAHTSGLGSNLLQRTDDTFIENLERYFAGSPLQHVLTREQIAESGALPR
jgi:phosphoglycerate dehydrogenase-like enzyme